MDDDDLLGQLASDGSLLIDAAARAGWDAPAPGLQWNVRQVVAHTGAVHRWAADIVRRQLPADETGGSAAFQPDLADAELPAWFRDGLTALVDTLRSAPDDLAAFTFIRGDPPRRFWIRRQAHETAIHRADVEAAAGVVSPFDADFAQDGIAEIVEGFGRGRSFASAEPGTLALVTADGPSRLVTFGGERNVAVRTEDVAGADAAVTGPSSDVYLWSWNRPSPVVVSGAAAVAALWRKVSIT